jgi:ribose/xylose/arabinose/galactoside ABC-type transport system permease subunit
MREPTATGGRRSAHAAGLLRKYGIVVALLLLVAYFGLTTRDHTFIRRDNLLHVTDQISVNLALAVGMTFVIVSGGIDLSVGSLVGLTGTVAGGVLMFGLAWPWSEQPVPQAPYAPLWVLIPLAVLAGLTVGALCGLFNGLVITRFRVPPFIATLAVMLVARGAANILMDGGRVGNLYDQFAFLGGGRVPALILAQREILPPIPVAALVSFAAALLAHLILTRTTFGRHVFAIGGNEEAARLSGLSVRRAKLAIYAGCGLLAGLGGVLEASRVRCGNPTAGTYYELDAIAAVVVGGASLMGGIGSISGTVLGALLIGTLNNGLVHKGVSEFYQLVVRGLVILGAVILDQVTKGL